MGTMRTSDYRDQLDTIVQRLVDTFHPTRIILFGSYAAGTQTKESDLDLLIIVSESNVPPHRRAQQAYHALRGISAPKDLLVFTKDEFDRGAKIATSLARHALERGEVLYERRETDRSTPMAHQEPA